jgi:hypothetical protein
MITFSFGILLKHLTRRSWWSIMKVRTTYKEEEKKYARI